MAEIKLASLSASYDGEFTLVTHGDEEQLQRSMDKVWAIVYQNIGDEEMPQHLLNFVAPSLMHKDVDAAFMGWLWTHEELKEFHAALGRILDRYE